MQPISHINIIAKYQVKPHSVLSSASFDENTRVFTGVKSFDPAGNTFDITNAPPGPYGNDTSSAGPNLVQPIKVNAHGTIDIAGNHWSVNSLLAFSIGTVLIGSSTTNGTGYFNGTAIIPILPAGTTLLKIVNNGVTYEFSIDVRPTMVLTPASGPVGTHVTIQAYGFPTNTKWFLYWHEHSLGDATWYQIAHGTTDATGSFNVSVSFVVPNSYGGSHLIAASTTNVTKSSPSPPATVEVYVGSSVAPSVSTMTTTTTTTTVYSTVTQPTTLTETITQSTTQTQTSSQPTTIIQSLTQTRTLTEATTTTTTNNLSTSSPTLEYVALGVVAIVTISAVVAWALRGRRP